MKKLIVLIILTTCICTQAQTADEKETLKKLIESVVSSYRSQKFDEALTAAQQAVDLSVKIYGNRSLEAAAAFTDLGVIYREKRDFKKSVENLQRAVEIYEDIADPTNAQQIHTYEALAYSHFLDGKAKEAEVNYAKALKSAATGFGSESKEVFSPTMKLANFFASSGNLEIADQYYLKSYALAIKYFGADSKQFEQIEDSRICFVVQQSFSSQKSKTSKSIFYEEKKKILGSAPDKSAMLNAKAKELPPPVYPPDAKQKRIQGTTVVRVQIDEKGNVTEVKPVCGNELLLKATMDAVKHARFETASVDGKPVKLSGYVTYRYLL